MEHKINSSESQCPEYHHGHNSYFKIVQDILIFIKWKHMIYERKCYGWFDRG